jgi:natural product precursor
VKKLKKLQLKKVTLRDLDEPTMQGVAGGAHTSAGTCPPASCAVTCPGECGYTHALCSAPIQCTN